MKLTHAMLGLALAAPALAGPINEREVPAASRAVLHVDLEALMDSEIGEFLIDHADLDGLDEIEREFGLNPLEDIRDITFCLLGDDDEEAVILATVTGAFEEVLEKIGQFGEEIDHKVDERFGGDWHSLDMDGKRIHALVREVRGGYRIAISPDRGMLETVGETIEGDRDSIRDRDHPLGRVRPADGAFVQLVAFDLSELPNGHELPHNLGERLKGVIAQIGEDDGKVFCHARLGLGSDEDAENVMKVGQGLVAMLQLAQSMDEGHDEDLETVIRFAKGLKIERDGSVVDARFEFDTDDFLDIAKDLN